MQVMPLHSAAAGNHNAVAMRLVEAGANVNAVQAGGFTPLMAAAQNGNSELAQFLIGKGADVNARTDKGSAEFSNMTALGLAQQANAPEVAALLEAAGATL
jgi:ankyrin repeat protein